MKNLVYINVYAIETLRCALSDMRVYYLVIQTTEGRKNLVYINVYATETLRSALSDMRVYYLVIQTTEGRKNLVYIHVDASETLRSALSDRKSPRFFASLGMTKVGSICELRIQQLMNEVASAFGPH